MSKTKQWIFQAVLFTGTIVCLGVVTSANTGSVHAMQQDQYGLTLDWVGGAPPKFMCVGDSVETMFVLRFTPNPDLVPLIPIAAPGKPTTVPPPAGGSLDINATNGTVDPSHWSLDFAFRLGYPLAASFTYDAKTQGEGDLTLTYKYNDSGNNYTGSTSVHFHVQQCDYRVKFTLQRDGTYHYKGYAGTGGGTVTGEGGFHIKLDERNGNGNTVFYGDGTTEYTFRQDMGAFGTMVQLPTGSGTLVIIGEILENGNLEMDINLRSVVASGGVWVNPAGSAPYPTETVSLDSKYLLGMTFPTEGGTQSFSGPMESQTPNWTFTESVEVTVSKEEK